MGRRAVGLFAGIGGIELGLHQAGFTPVLLSEIWEPAIAVLEDRFPEVPLVGDVATIDRLPDCDLVAAGFPCQDLSQAGRTEGIGGSRSGLVSNVFRLLDGCEPEWLVLENVPFMLRLDRGAAMSYLTAELDRRGYRWAYRVVDSLAFGLPQRRKRVLLVASPVNDPRAVLFADDAGAPVWPDETQVGCGFYWTEGIRGLGWAVDAVPTLKGGSSIGIPSPPAIRLPDGGGLVLPDLLDAERLQGFDADWTIAAELAGIRKGLRWKLVGNAVSVPMARWLGGRIREPGKVETTASVEVIGGPWPDAAWSDGHGSVFAADVSHFPVHEPRPPLLDFLEYPTRPLSERATAGFLERTTRSSLRFPEGFLDDVEAHLERVRVPLAA